MTAHALAMFSQPLVERLAWTLIHFVWQGTLVWTCLAVVLRWMRGSAAAARYLASCIALLLMAALPVLTFSALHVNADPPRAFAEAEPGNARGDSTASRDASEAGRPGLMRRPGRAATSAGPDRDGRSVEDAHGRAGEAAAARQNVGGAPVGTAAPASGGRPASAARQNDSPYAAAVDASLPWLVAIWIVGVSLLSVWHVFGWLLSQRWRWWGTSRVSAEVRQMTGRLCRRLGIARAVSVRQSAVVAVPMIIGWFKPVLLAPACALSGLSGSELEAILAHELVHIRRHDYLVNLLQTAVETVLFYHPAVWWVSGRIRIEREYCADDWAVRTCAAPDVYAKALAALVRISRKPPRYAVASTGPALVTRIGRVLGLSTEARPRGLRRLRRASSAAGLLVAAGLAACLAATVGSQRPHAVAADSQPKAEPHAVPAKDEPSTGARITYAGLVVERGSGKPIANAAVAARFIATDAQQRWLGSVLAAEEQLTTDRQGKYALKAPAELAARSDYHVRLDVHHPGYASQRGYAGPSHPQRPNRFELCPGIESTGRVLTPDGREAAGVRVHGFWRIPVSDNPCADPSSPCQTVTDRQGRFSLMLPETGAAVLWLLPKRLAPSELLVRDKRGDLGVFRLKKGAALNGRVLDMEGKPIADVPVAAGKQRIEGDHGVGPAGSAIRRVALTGAQGEFTLRPLAAGEYHLAVRRSYDDPSEPQRRYYRQLPAVFYSQTVVLEEGVDPQPVVLQAVPHVTITARYLDDRGQPTTGHEIMLSAVSRRQSWSAKIEGGGISFSPNRTEIRSWSTTGRPDSHGKVVMRAPQGAEVTLHLVAKREHAIKFRTGPDSPPRHALLGHRAELGTVDSDMPDVSIRYHPAPVVIVKVAASDGGKLRDVKVRGAYHSGREYDWVNFRHQPDDGRYRSLTLAPDEQVTVTATAPGYAPQATTVSLPEGQVREIELLLEKEPVGRSRSPAHSA